ncbi:hypothetical protein V8E54_001466 [Elaphomyces granulatus]
MAFFLRPITPLASNMRLSGKTAIVTGPTAGLGFETCRQLMELGCSTLILACRDISKGFKTCETLLSEHSVRAKNEKPPSMKVMKLDLEDFNSVQSFADKVKSEIPIVDILILNAGVGFVGNLQFSKDGHEITLQTNYLSNALLVLELLPHLQQSALQTGTQTKITWLGSRSAYESNLARNLSVESSIFQHMDDPKNYSVKDRYADTKLLSYIFMSTLAKRLSSSPSLSLDDDTSNDKSHNNQMGFSDRNTESVIINMVCPGLIATDFTYKHLPLWAKLLVLLLLFLVARTVEQGVWSIINAVAVAGAESHGEFLLDKDVKAVPPFLLTPNGKRFRQQVWKETMMQIGKIRTTRTSPKST